MATLLIQLAILMCAYALTLLAFLTVSYWLALRERDRRVAQLSKPVCDGEQHEH
jgi:hypothetical protein